MNLKHGMLVMLVKDAGRAKDFYVNVLGMTVKAQFGEHNFVFEEGFAVWQPLEKNIIPRELGPAIHDRDAVSRFELCFETDNIDRDHKILKDNGVKFLHELNEELWGQRTVRFYDPDGHLVEIGESLPVFVKGIYDEVGNLDKAAEKLFMPQEMVAGILGL